jgi:hypothetical protein
MAIPRIHMATLSRVNLLFARVCIEHPLDMGKLGEVGTACSGV